MMAFASRWPTSFQEAASGEPSLQLRDLGLQILEVYLFLRGHDVKGIKRC